MLGTAWGGGIGLGVALFGLLLLILSCISTHDGFLLVGPHARAEAARNARKGKPWFWRVIYSGVAALILLLHLNSSAPEVGWFGPVFKVVPLGRIAGVSTLIANWFAVCLFLYVSVVTVQMIAPAVAEDRAAKRWDVLMTTDLRPREVFFGKLIGRAPVIFDPILTAIPILSVLPFYGGVSAWFAVAVLVACFAVILGLAGMSFFYSLFATSASQATGYVFGMSTVYLVLSGLAWLISLDPTSWNFNFLPFLNRPQLLIGDLVEAFSAGNPVVLLILFLRSSTDPEAAALRLVGNFAAFQLGVFLIFGLMAMKRMRLAQPWGSAPAKVAADLPAFRQRAAGSTPVAEQSGDAPRAKSLILSTEKPRPQKPPIPDESVFWWQLYGKLSRVDIAMRTKLNWSFLITIAVGSLIWGVLAALDVRDNGKYPRPGVVHNVYVAVVMSVYGLSWFILLCPPLFRAARSLVQERTSDTLESLLLTALTPREILTQKLKAVFIQDWPFYAVTLALTIPAAICGVVPVLTPIIFGLAIPPLVLALGVVGMYCSTRAKSPGQASRMAIGCLFAGYLLFAAIGSFISNLRVPGIQIVMGGLILGGILLSLGKLWNFSVRILENERVN